MSTFVGTWRAGDFKTEEKIISIKPTEKGLIVIWDFDLEGEFQQKGLWEWTAMCWRAKDDKSVRPVRADIDIDGQLYEGCVPKKVTFGDEYLELEMRCNKKVKEKKCTKN